MEENKIFCIDDAKLKHRDEDLESTTSGSSYSGSSRSDSVTGMVTYKTRWVVLAIFSLISMANAVIWISLSSITSIVKDYYQVSYSVVNWLAMIFSVFYIFVLLSAYCLNKYGLKFTILVGAVCNALASCLRLIGSGRDGFIFVLMGNGLAGLAQAFILFVPPTLAATWFGESERSTASAIGMLMNMLGVAIGYLMGGTLVPSSDDFDGEVKNGIFMSLFLQAVFCTILVVISVIFVRRVPLTPPSFSQALLVKNKAHKKKQKELSKEKEVHLRSYIHPNYANETFETSGEFFEYSDDKKTQSKPTTAVDSSNNGDSSNNEFETVGFLKSFKIIAKNKNFLLITQSYGLYFGLYLAINTLLNHICTVNFKGKEQAIGIMGSVSVVLGLVAIFLAGIWLDKTRRYKLIGVGTFGMCAITLLIFMLVLKHSKSFNATFVCFCVFGFFSYPYIIVGLEHAAEVVFPISEGITSGILLLMANIYAIILTYLLEFLIESWGTDVAGYVMVVLYFIGQFCCFVTNGELKRYKADQSSLSSSYVGQDNNSIGSGSYCESMGEQVNQAYMKDVIDV